MFSFKMLEVHKYKIHDPERRNFECDLCKKKLASSKQLTIHKNTKHDIKKRPWVCEICKKQWETSNSYRRHKRIFHTSGSPKRMAAHQKGDTIVSHACEECGRLFRTKSGLDFHTVVVHTKERNFKCNYCPATFSRKFTWKSHASLHT